jgi:dienelactone hydrolase
VVVFHAAPGLGDEPKRRTRMPAEELGYVALAADVYGGGQAPAVGPAAMARMQPLIQDRAELRRRAVAALDALKALPNVDETRVAAIGYCFGGSTVIEMARGGTDLNGVVSFHGGLKTNAPAEPGAIKAKMLILTGEKDPTIPLEDRNAAQEEFSRGGADWQMIVYSGALHSFTNPDTPPMEGFAYHEAADRRSWQHMKDFFAEVLA